jgi:peptidoglycan/xylan/chitin deacetylase (PgdA/CDA1 family)
MTRRAFLLLLMLATAVPGIAPAQELAITFDDLPLNGTLPPGMTRTELVQRVVKVLKHYHVPPVYGFVNARRFEGDQDGAQALKHWVAAGEHVGNHTYSHPDLNKVTSELFMADVYQNEPVLELLGNGDDWHWFRYPFLREGDTLEKRRSVRAALTQRGYRIAEVTLDYEDYLWNSPYARCVATHDAQSLRWLHSSYLAFASEYIDADRQMAHLTLGRDPSHVLLLHLGAFSDTILPDLLTLLRQKGFKLVTLEEAQRDPAYQSDPDAGSRNGGTLLEQLMDARGIRYPAVTPKPYKELAAICQDKDPAR